MHTTSEIFSKIEELKRRQRAVPENARDRAERLDSLQGEINVWNGLLGDAIAAEEGARHMPDGTIVSYADPHSPTLQAFGPRSQFTGIRPGFRAAITVPASPTVTDPTVPGFADGPRGFADTLVQAPTQGSVTYLRRGARVNAAAQWTDADGGKAESSYVWTEQTAALAWIAHHVPIAKTQASDWGQLDAIIRGEMMLGLKQAKNRQALVGSNPAGIVGITNTVGIQTHTIASGDNAYDAIRRMVTKVYLASGFAPTHVAVAPQVDEALDLLKDDQKAYLQVKSAGRVWSLEVVVDDNLAVHDATAGETHFGMIVYASAGATWYTKEQDNVEIGLVDDQFINNAYTLLAEGRYGLGVRFPDAFCYCQDAIPAVADAS